MARRRYEDDEDDDDLDDRPIRRSTPKKSGGGKTVWIVLGIVGVVILILVVGCAGLVYYGVSSAKKAVDDVGDRFRANAEAENFLFKLSTDNNAQTAYDSTAPGFKTSMSRDQFQQLLTKYPQLTKINTRRAITSNNPTGSSPNRKLSITYEVTRFFDEPEPWTPPGQGPPPAPKPPAPAKTITVTIGMAEQPGGFWKVESFAVQ